MAGALLAMFALPLLALLWGYAGAIGTPVVRKAAVELAGLPPGTAPLRLVLISDIHVAGPDMPPERLRRIVAQINALRPDLVLIAGDFVSDKRPATRYYSLPEAIAPLRALKPRLASVAVLGNHDHWRDAGQATQALRAAGIGLLRNSAVQVGPLAIGGLDDDFTGRADLPATVAEMRKPPGARILLTHSPDPFADVPNDIGLTLAGHTHCGQIAPPLIGPLATASRYGRRYACGVVREGAKTLIVGAGLGTSMLPLRIGARPEIWLVKVSAPELSTPHEMPQRLRNSVRATDEAK